MNFPKYFIPRIFLILISNQLFFTIPRVNSAENIKIIYSVFSRTIELDSLKTFAEKGYSSKKLNRILRATGSSDSEIQSALNIQRILLKAHP